MSAEKCGESITFEKVQGAFEKASKEGGRPHDRIISYSAHQLLKQIHRKLPNWNNWTFEPEIWFKARSMGLIEEE